MKSFYVLIIALFLVGCSGKDYKSADIPVIDVVAAIEGEPCNNLEFDDVRFTPLDTSAVSMFGERSYIKAVQGDTIVIEDEHDRLVLFNLKNGKFINEISRKGNGPGEYSWIQGAFLDDATGELTISDANSSHAIILTLNDSLISDTKCRNLRNRRFPIGYTHSCINIGVDTDEGFVIHQFDRFFNEIDSLLLPGFDMNYYGGEFFSANGRTALITNLSDTLYTILPGQMEPFAVLARGGKEITPADADKIMADYKSVSQDNFIKLFYSAWDDEHLFLVSSYQENLNLDIFDLTSGGVLYHLPIDKRSERDSTGVEVPFEGKTYHVVNPFVKDNRWYGIVSEAEAMGEEGGEGNCAIISFNLR